MEPAIPWYRSAIIRQQIVAFILAAFALVKYKTNIDVDATVGAILAGFAAIIPVYTIATRLFKPTPALTQTAADKHADMVAENKVPPVVASKQAGFFRLSIAVFCSLFAVGVLSLLPGCAGTAAAYKAASSLPDTAYVVEEHYSAVLKEAADLAASPTIDPAVKQAMKDANARVAPIIVGDSAAGRPGLRELVQKYQAVHNAKSAEELQAALDSAVLELAKLINAVKSARS